MRHGTTLRQRTTFLRKSKNPKRSSVNNTNRKQFMTEKHEKRRDALGLFYESVLKPDPELRNCAHNQKCFNELMEWRDEIIRYLDERRNQEFH
jgi:hypothetical protein